jgi:hypothetical protein
MSVNELNRLYGSWQRQALHGRRGSLPYQPAKCSDTETRRAIATNRAQSRFTRRHSRECATMRVDRTVAMSAALGKFQA